MNVLMLLMLMTSASESDVPSGNPECAGPCGIPVDNQS
jgi:hypothetical protein